MFRQTAGFYSHRISNDTIRDILKAAVETNFQQTGEHVPIVSIGSGTGFHEYQIFKKGRWDAPPELICVDPDPTISGGYDSVQFVKPHYATVQDLIRARPTILGNCIMLMIWPNPAPSSYDFEALAMLMPRSSIIMWEMKGGAGGSNFHKWFKDGHKGYHMLTQHTHRYVLDSFVKVPCYDSTSWFLRDDFERPRSVPKDYHVKESDYDGTPDFIEAFNKKMATGEISAATLAHLNALQTSFK